MRLFNFKTLAWSGTALVALTACQQPTEENVAADGNNFAASSDIERLPPSEAGGPAGELDSGSDAAEGLDETDDTGSELPSPPDTPESRMIPSQYRGRWGMVAADCDINRSDAKGAITIGERAIVFYESRAMLKEPRPAIATSFSGLFAFTGEGQKWEEVMTFTRSGDTLTRADNKVRITYMRCK